MDLCEDTCLRSAELRLTLREGDRWHDKRDCWTYGVLEREGILETEGDRDDGI